MLKESYFYCITNLENLEHFYKLSKLLYNIFVKELLFFRKKHV